MIGTSDRYAEVREFWPARGSFLAGDEGERVIVLGHAVAKELSADGLRPGEVVYLGMNPFTVIGVLLPQGVNFAGEDEDHQVFVPHTTYMRRIANRPWLHHIYLRISPRAESETVVREVRAALRDRHGRRRGQVDDVIVRNLADVAAEQTSLLDTATWAVTATSGLLLILGVVGIATLMVLVVRQRRFEIGLRRAIGATPMAIAVQFLLEGCALAIVGVIAGIVVGAALGWMVGVHANTPASIDLRLPLLGAAFSLAVSIAACLFPAIIAASMEPARALRT
jgi:putative ABC transport system permease protein